MAFMDSSLVFFEDFSFSIAHVSNKRGVFLGLNLITP